jgi:hypothetical protein
MIIPQGKKALSCSLRQLNPPFPKDMIVSRGKMQQCFEFFFGNHSHLIIFYISLKPIIGKSQGELPLCS